MKATRRQRTASGGSRVKAARRIGRSLVEERSALPRPANDVGIELELPEPPMVEAVFAAAVDDLPAELEPIETAVVVVPEEDLEVELAPVPEEEGDDDSETEEEEEVVARPAEPGGEVKKSDEPQSFLSMYFRDMAELEVLRPEQEFETARHIEELELGLWRVILSFTPWAGHAVSTIEAAIGRPLPEFRAYRSLADRAGRRAGPAKNKKFEKLVDGLAAKLKELDSK